MHNLKLKKTIDTLSEIVNVDDSRKEKLYSKYADMEDAEIIKDLSQIAYILLANNDELYDFALATIRDINPEICPSVEEMKAVLTKLFSNERKGNMSLEENHKLINEFLVKIANLFNQYEVDYYIVGALPCFIKTGQQLFRYHDDIDIMVSEDDIPKISEIMKLVGYEFYDDRFPSVDRFKEMEKNKPPHTVLAQNPDNEFHLGFFTFKREKDDSITMREYSHKMEDNSVVVDLLERKLTPKGTSLRYDEEPTQYLGSSFKTSSVESVYKLKQYTRRPKDITDVQRLQPFIDLKKLEDLNENPAINVEHKNIEKPCSRKK